MPAKIIPEQLFPAGAPTSARSSLSNIILLKQTGVRVITLEQATGEPEMAASGAAFRYVPSGTWKSNGANVPAETGRSWKAKGDREMGGWGGRREGKGGEG